MQYLPVAFMGATSLIMQIICLRQLLSTFSGNELIIGITLAAWLVLVALGSFLGTKCNLKNAFGVSFLLVALAAPPSVTLIKLVRTVAGYAPGEVIPLTVTILWTVLSMAALCIIIGIQFPLAVAYLREKAPEVYSLEAAGAFAGGLVFTFLLAGRVDSYSVTSIITAINIVISYYLLRKKVLLSFLIVPLAFYAAGLTILSSYQYGGFEITEKRESRYGELVVFKKENQSSIYSSEKYLFSYPDLQAEEMKAHMPMSIHPVSTHILVIGGSPAVIREFLRYPVSRLDFVEIDRALIDISNNILTADDRQYLQDERVRIVEMDARRFIKSLSPAHYDLIVLNMPEPSSANTNRFYTVEFFREVKSVLNEKGILYLSMPTSSGYIGRRMQLANGSIFASIRKVFPHVEVSSEEYGIITASKNSMDTNPDVLIANTVQSDTATKYFRPYILRDAFDPLKVSMVKGRLNKIQTLNTDKRPVSYLYNLMLWSEVHGGKWLNTILGLSERAIIILISIVFISVAAFFLKRNNIIPFTLFTTGYVTMAFTLIVMLAYQAYAGYIYEKIGLLTGTFMLGGAIGAYGGRRLKKTLFWLRIYDVFLLALMLSAMAIMNFEFIFYLMIFGAGILGGGQFAAAAITLRGTKMDSTAGKLYAIDLAGSFLGSLLTAILTVPLIGMHKTILFLLIMKAASFVFLVRYRKTY
jgi:spermidine synthase